MPEKPRRPGSHWIDPEHPVLGLKPEFVARRPTMPDPDLPALAAAWDAYEASRSTNVDLAAQRRADFLGVFRKQSPGLLAAADRLADLSERVVGFLRVLDEGGFAFNAVESQARTLVEAVLDRGIAEDEVYATRLEQTSEAIADGRGWVERPTETCSRCGVAIQYIAPVNEWRNTSTGVDRCIGGKFYGSNRPPHTPGGEK